MNRVFLVLLASVLLSGCSMPLFGGSGCPPNTSIEWLDIVQIKDIEYVALEPGNYQVKEEDHGEVLGKVAYRMAEQACSNHKMQNGDAAYLAVGTEIQEFEGYKTDFRVIADGKVYEVDENEEAQTIGDLYDIEGEVEGMSLRSSYDGSHVMDLNEEHWIRFVDEFLALDYVGFDEIYKKIGNEEGTFLDIHLMDGSSVRINYWTDANVLNPGAYGNEEMKKIIDFYN